MKKEKVFKPRPGQTDFTHIKWAPVINCVVKYRSKILIVKRSQELRLYPGYWNGISGFLDDGQSLEQKVLQEVREELGLAKKNIRSIKLGAIFHQEAPKYKKMWIVHPILVTVNTNKVTLDWEAQEYRWTTPSEALHLKLLPGFNQVLENLFQKK
jgi:ADP-ribose pyrophosphatase YjhB (NUDIX family)